MKCGSPMDLEGAALMEQLDLGCYVGLLSAAQYHGTAHHRPQEFQVMTGKKRRGIARGAVRVSTVEAACASRVIARDGSERTACLRIAVKRRP